MHLGTAWYPHWPEERWARDIELMVAADMTVVRVGEFAWSSMELADGDIRLGGPPRRRSGRRRRLGRGDVPPTPTPRRG